jgi:hypothetical protein
MGESPKLTRDAEVELLRLLGRDVQASRIRTQIITDPASGDQKSQVTEVGKLFGAIENALGFFIGGQKHLDHIPRPAHYLREFQPIRRQAHSLYKMLDDMGDYFRSELTGTGADVSAIEAALHSLVHTSDAVLEKYKRVSSKGAPKNAALMETIKKLRHIFRSQYVGERTGRTKKGAFISMGEEEKCEVAFVKTALFDARIIPSSTSDADIRRHFRDPRCAVPGEQNIIRERIAARAERPAARSRRDTKDPESLPSEICTTSSTNASRTQERNK